MLRLQQSEEEREEELEEAEESNIWFRTDHICPCCQEYLLYTDEIFLLEAVEAAQDGGEIVCAPFLDAAGDYLFEPLIVHLECWEEICEQIREIKADELPVEIESGIIYCTQCDSTIGSFEPFVSATFGEIQVSQRRPSGSSANKVERIGRMDPVCMACMVLVIEDYLENWVDLLESLNINCIKEAPNGEY